MATARFRPRSNYSYLALFKPFAVLSQFTSPADSDKRTLADFGLPQHVYPIGRLDWDSEGLLLLSDDPQLNHALLNPLHGHSRTYLAQVENIPTVEALTALKTGVVIQNERTRPAQAKLLEEEPLLPPRPVPVRFRKNIPTAWIELTLTEGKNRQVRKMTAAIGCPTLRLIRIAIGELYLPAFKLEPGQWVVLSAEELQSAFAGTSA